MQGRNDATMSTLEPARLNRTYVALASLLVGSGFCSLVYQTMWLRELRAVFGASTPATAAVLAVFMAGLGAGGWVLGGRAERSHAPLRLYALLEVGIAVSAALSPFLVDAARAAYYALGGTSSLGGGGALVVRLASTIVALGVPVFLMGGTFPAMARALMTSAASTSASSGTETRRPLALLYGANTLGAVMGAASSTFLLLEVYGVRTSLWLACVLNALVAAIAFSAARRARASVPPTSVPAANPASNPAPGRAGGPALPRSLIAFAAFATGFAFLLLELVWYRMCAPLLGGSTYSFGLVLAIALFGVGLGGLAYAWVGPVRPTPGRFAVTCALQAVLLLVPFAVGDGIAQLAYALRALGAPTFGGLVLSWTAIAALLVLLPSLVAGWQFPLLLALSGDGSERAAKDSGQVYAANTFGAIAGSIAGGFGALPLLGALGAWKLVAGVLVAAGALFAARAVFAERERERERGRVIAFGALAVCALMLTVLPEGPTALWRHNAIGAGRGTATASTWNEREWLRRHMSRQVLEEHDGVESSLAFLGRGHGESLVVNGKSDGATLGDPQTQVGLAVVPALLHGATGAPATPATPAKTAFVIGLGTGQTAGWLAAMPGMERVDVAEIEPKVIEFARRNADTNFNVVDAKNVNMFFADGREALATSSQTYDIIVSEPSNPYRAGIASFYSVDFYEEARARLAPGGVFAQWLQAYEIEATAMQTAVATMLSVFPHAVALRLQPGDLLIVARADDDDPSVDVARLRALVATEPYRTAMTRIMMNPSAEGLLSRVYANDAFLHRLAATVPPGAYNTDDVPLLEVSFARSVGKEQRGEPVIDELFTLARRHGEHALQLRGDVDAALIESQRARFLIASNDGDAHPTLAFDPLESAWVRGNLDVAAALLDAERAAAGGATDAGRALAVRPNAADVVGRMIRAAVDAQRGRTDPNALAALASEGFATEVTLLRLDAALAQHRAGEVPALVDDVPALVDDVPALVDEACDLLARDPWVHQGLLAAVLQRVSTTKYPAAVIDAIAERLLAHPFAGRANEMARIRAGEALLRQRASAPSASGGASLPLWCLKVFEPFEPHPLWTATWLDDRLSCYRAHPQAVGEARVVQAQADLDAFVEHSAMPLASLLPSR